MATVLTLEQHASNVNHLEADNATRVENCEDCDRYPVTPKKLHFSASILAESTATSGTRQRSAKKEN